MKFIIANEYFKNQLSMSEKQILERTIINPYLDFMKSSSYNINTAKYGVDIKQLYSKINKENMMISTKSFTKKETLVPELEKNPYIKLELDKNTKKNIKKINDSDCRSSWNPFRMFRSKKQDDSCEQGLSLNENNILFCDFDDIKHSKFEIILNYINKVDEFKKGNFFLHIEYSKIEPALVGKPHHIKIENISIYSHPESESDTDTDKYEIEEYIINRINCKIQLDCYKHKLDKDLKKVINAKKRNDKMENILNKLDLETNFKKYLDLQHPEFLLKNVSFEDIEDEKKVIDLFKQDPIKFIKQSFLRNYLSENDMPETDDYGSLIIENYEFRNDINTSLTLNKDSFDLDKYHYKGCDSSLNTSSTDENFNDHQVEYDYDNINQQDKNKLYKFMKQYNYEFIYYNNFNNIDINKNFEINNCQAIYKYNDDASYGSVVSDLNKFISNETNTSLNFNLENIKDMINVLYKSKHEHPTNFKTYIENIIKIENILLFEYSKLMKTESESDAEINNVIIKTSRYFNSECIDYKTRINRMKIILYLKKCNKYKKILSSSLATDVYKDKGSLEKLAVITTADADTAGVGVAVAVAKIEAIFSSYSNSKNFNSYIWKKIDGWSGIFFNTNHKVKNINSLVEFCYSKGSGPLPRPNNNEIDNDDGPLDKAKLHKEITKLKYKLNSVINIVDDDDTKVDKIKCKGKFDLYKSKKIAYQTKFAINEYVRFVENE
uniref:Uncharacterized protein n=1 Tax=Florenciella sp. virus SA2 TaxID=3240092 RepID=A0AB39JEW4_9VIRU